MRFDSKAYDKLFPRKKEKENIESAVDTFTPTTDEQEETVDSNVENVDNSET